MIRLRLYTWLTIFFRQSARYISFGLWLLPWRLRRFLEGTGKRRPNFAALEVARTE
jgi:hypothetical protein